MNPCWVDVLVVGGGAAGMAAAAAAAREGARTWLVERDDRLGGVLDQCIHPGFGLHRYREELTGPEFAHRLLGELEASGAEVVPACTVLDVDPAGPTVTAVGPGGAVRIRPRAIVWAAGARERPFGALQIPGSRPAGIYTAGLAQRLVNVHGFLPGRRAIVLGSGDIGLIMARRLHLEGVEVVAVLELRPFPGGLLRNVVQCLEDFGIPLLLRHTVARVHGRDRLSGVTVVEVDDMGRPIPGTETLVEVDTLILSVGLIPEAEGIPFVPLDPVNRGPRVDSRFRTEVPWLFVAGNALAVFDLVDVVAQVGEAAGACAARHARGELLRRRPIPLVRGENVLHLVPTALDPEAPATLYLRVPRPLAVARVEVGPGVLVRNHRGVRPAEMVAVKLPPEAMRELARLPEVEVRVVPG
ncbi:MAG: NAD(P)/FAD-dependent oxidoreductase [Candidatus Acetothermia bacterium]|jgi:NADPH-dependent 2,4-dienoyl-CoA reductase/sulfur reductase-like enzyme|nr:NAD(P)/FAD-dependent oxidoreductase [Candidatus Acetothermia bacterium]